MTKAHHLGLSLRFNGMPLGSWRHSEGNADRALILELVSGQTPQRSLPSETALNYARQIADALEAVHEKNII